MSDLLMRLKRCLDGGIGCNVCVNQLPEAITALRALEDLETIVNQSYVSIFRCPVNQDYIVRWNSETRDVKSTLPAALRAAVEAIKKGETE